MKTPILFFAFNRAAHAERVLRSLAANPEAKSARLFAFIDGPRDADEEARVDAVERVVRSERWCGSVEVLRRAENIGCPRSVIGALNEFTGSYGSAIVIEDDVLLSPYFLRFIGAGLEKYRDDDRVMEVSGYRYPVRSRSPRSGFTPMSIAWGWGTWKRAWSRFEPDGAKSYAQIIASRELSRQFDVDDSFHYVRMLKWQVDGLIGGWDIRWSASVFLAGSFALYPAAALCTNIGMDGTGQHQEMTKDFDAKLAPGPVEDLPDKVEEDSEYRRALRLYLLRISQGALHQRVIRRARRPLSVLKQRAVAMARSLRQTAT